MGGAHHKTGEIPLSGGVVRGMLQQITSSITLWTSLSHGRSASIGHSITGGLMSVTCYCMLMGAQGGTSALHQLGFW
eukprot:1752724-Karenia_brevis.AAC.1